MRLGWEDSISCVAENPRYVEEDKKWYSVPCVHHSEVLVGKGVGRRGMGGLIRGRSRTSVQIQSHLFF